MAERDFKGVWIPREIWLAEDIGWSAKLLLVEVDSLATNGECFASNDYLGQFFSLSKRRISELIGELREKGYVEVELVYKPGTKQIEKRLITTTGYRRKVLGGIVENFHTPPAENFPTPIAEKCADNNTSSFTNTSSISTKENVPPKESKKKYGEYSHVLLKDSELAKLREEYGDGMTQKAITYLDEYIEMKGYKARSHYLAIRKWVVDAVKEKEQKRGKGRQEVVPDWMEKSDGPPTIEQMRRMHAAMAGNNPEVAARAEALKRELQGG